jgi:hypothetical protein
VGRRGHEGRDEPSVGVRHEHDRRADAVAVELPAQRLRLVVDPVRQWGRAAATEPRAVADHRPDAVATAYLWLELVPDRGVLAPAGLEHHGRRARAAKGRPQKAVGDVV